MIEIMLKLNTFSWHKALYTIFTFRNFWVLYITKHAAEKSAMHFF